jgi:AcrR family transcriptional regulator
LRSSTSPSRSPAARSRYYPSKEALFLACSKRAASVQLDYVGDREPHAVRDDPAILEVAEGMVTGVGTVVGDDRAEAVLSAIFAVLLLRWFDGQATSFPVLEEMLRRLLTE